MNSDSSNNVGEIVVVLIAMVLMFLSFGAMVWGMTLAMRQMSFPLYLANLAVLFFSTLVHLKFKAGILALVYSVMTILVLLSGLSYLFSVDIVFYTMFTVGMIWVLFASLFRDKTNAFLYKTFGIQHQ